MTIRTGKLFLLGLWTMTLAVTGSAQSRGADSSRTAFQELAGDDDPVSFVQAVNQSMAKDDDKLDAKRIHTLYKVNRDQVRGAPAAIRKKVLAEVFATAPVKCLPHFTDLFAKEVFARNMAGYGPQDEAFVEFASAALMQISMRCRRADNLPAYRTVYAVIMFLKASEGYPQDLREAFMIYIHSGLHEIARKEWIPAAMGDKGEAPTYRPMVEAGHRQEVPDHRIQIGSDDPAEIRNRTFNSDHVVEFGAWDVQSPTPRETWRSEVPGGDGTGAGLWRTPGPYLGQSL